MTTAERKPRRRKKKKQYRMPKFYWHLSGYNLKSHHKRLLAFIWFCGDAGCTKWDYQLATKFDVDRRTIQHWLKRLHDLGLIHITMRHTRHRRIFRMPLYQRAVCEKWLAHYKKLTVGQKCRTPLLRSSQKRPTGALLTDSVGEAEPPSQDGDSK